jgi:heavy metal sensor kinase
VIARRLPIRWRLTLWYALLLAAAMTLFASAVYIGLRQQLYASFDEQLLDQAALVLATIHIKSGVPALAPGAQNAEYFLRLLAEDGRVIADSDGQFGNVPLDRAALAAAIAGATRFDLVAVTPDEGRDGELAEPADPGAQGEPSAQGSQGQQMVRLVTLPVRLDDEGPPVGALQVGLDRDDIDEALAQLLTVLAFATPLVLLAAAAGGYLLAGRALAPVAAMTLLAARITARDLSARLDLELPDDELGRLARTFDAMLSRIDDAFARQRRFTGDAAHELRTPLSLMRSQLDLALARPRSAAAYREALRGLDGDVTRMTNLVAALLTLARADAGKLVAERAPFDLAATIDHLGDQYAPLAAAAGVALRCETTPTLLVADEDLLVQLLVNLLDNALAYTPAGGAVTVGCRSEDGRGRLWVDDSGQGIGSEHLPHLFDRFYRADAGRSRERGGTGLGLAICQAIVGAHDGSITIDSAPGRGTRVEVVLPGLDMRRPIVPA